MTLFLSPLSSTPVFVHILSPETDKCPSWSSGRESRTVENISWSISMTECCQTRRGSNPRPPDQQSDAHPSEPSRPALFWVIMHRKIRLLITDFILFNHKIYFPYFSMKRHYGYSLVVPWKEFLMSTTTCFRGQININQLIPDSTFSFEYSFRHSSR